jgi:hypothetical protein
MKNSILNLGKVLSKFEQKQIGGGYVQFCYSAGDCSRFECCSGGKCIDTRYTLEQPDCL